MTKGVTHLTIKGFQTNMHFLDSEAPEQLQQYDRKRNKSFQLVPLHSHQRNTAERAIRTWKNRCILGSCTVHPDFPIHLWGRLIQQSVITLNLLQPCRRNPAISAYLVLEGSFKYYATPLAPPGCKTIIYEHPTQRRNFAPHHIIDVTRYTFPLQEGSVSLILLRFIHTCVAILMSLH